METGSGDLGDRFAKLENDVRRSQETLQSGHNECMTVLGKWEKRIETEKATVLQKKEELEKVLVLNKEKKEKDASIKKDLERENERLMESIKEEKLVYDDQLRTLELKREHLKELENYCNEITKVHTEYRSYEEEHIKRLKQEIELYERMLGVKIRITDSEAGLNTVTFQITFTQISASNPEQEFVSTLSSGKMFKIVDCNPPLDNLVEDLKRLNEDQNLFKFVIALRSKFVQFATDKHN